MQIKELAKALHHGDAGLELAQSLRLKYPAALVDEFQDTDSYQYQILQKIYFSSMGEKTTMFACFLVGDPKAIYGFRGDVYTISKHQNSCTRAKASNLAANQRSVSLYLIHALKCIF